MLRTTISKHLQAWIKLFLTLPKTPTYLCLAPINLKLFIRDRLKKLEGIPMGQVALMRDRQTWLTADGKMARVYGMSGGLGEIVTSDDNFQSWEAEHIIQTANAGETAP
jgi:hypothetical protein